MKNSIKLSTNDLLINHPGSYSEELANFISEFVGVSVNKITMDTRIEADFKIGGDDIDDFFMKFSEKFKVDISKFDFDRHFDMVEGVGCLAIPALIFSLVKKYPQKKDLSISSLCRAIELGYLL